MREPWTGFSIVVSALVVALLLTGACSDSASPRAPSAFAGVDGASLYAQACASCHGADLRGTVSGPPFLDAIYRPAHHADAAFLLAVRRGARSHHWNFGDMPPIEGLSDEQVAAILEFVRSSQAEAGID